MAARYRLADSVRLATVSIDLNPRRSTARDLESVVEPLASDICASVDPPAALKFAVSVLTNEVEQVNRAAAVQLATFSRAVSPNELFVLLVAGTRRQGDCVRHSLQ